MTGALPRGPDCSRRALNPRTPSGRCAHRPDSRRSWQTAPRSTISSPPPGRAALRKEPGSEYPCLFHQVRRPQACRLRQARDRPQSRQPQRSGGVAGAGAAAGAECQARWRSWRWWLAAAGRRTGGAANRHQRLDRGTAWRQPSPTFTHDRWDGESRADQGRARLGSKGAGGQFQLAARRGRQCRSGRGGAGASNDAHNGPADDASKTCPGHPACALSPA